MPIAPTTVSDLRDAVATRIIALTPDHALERSTWQRVRSVKDVPSVARSFYLSIDAQRLSGEGIYTDSVATYEGNLQVWTSYIGMGDEDYEDLKSSDARQLWATLSAAGGPITGLQNIRHHDPLWEDGETSEEGTRWGAHVFTLTYLLEQP